METRASTFDEVRAAIQEKRAITMSGNGVINQVSEIVKLITTKTPILERIGYIYGKNAQTNIPLLDPGLALPSTVSEGYTTGSTDATAALTFKSITPIGYTSTLPVSWEALNLLSANLESELPALFAGVFASSMHTLAMGHLFHADGVATANKVEVTTGGAFPDIMDLVNLTYSLLDKNYLAPALVMNSAALVAAQASATDTVGKLYAEEIARSRTVNGIPIVITGSAPVDKAAGKTLVLAGDLNGYKMGIASELMIEPKKKVGDGNTYFDATLYFNGAVVQPKNFLAIIGKASG
jgi:HK97 family phage major capsid protein